MPFWKIFHSRKVHLLLMDRLLLFFLLHSRQLVFSVLFSPIPSYLCLPNPFHLLVFSYYLFAVQSSTFTPTAVRFPSFYSLLSCLFFHCISFPYFYKILLHYVFFFLNVSSVHLHFHALSSCLLLPPFFPLLLLSLLLISPSPSILVNIVPGNRWTSLVHR